MIQKFKDYDSIQVNEGGLALEPGGYELKILAARVEDFSSCSILKVRFDIVNHEQYENFFSKKYRTALAKNMNAKWSNNGVFDVFIPKDDGTEKDGYTKKAFKRFITSVENSNQGYVWNWDEQSLVGKVFGGVFGREQFEGNDGELKFTVKCRFSRSIEIIRNGDYNIPEDKMLKGKTAANNNIGNLDEYENILAGDMPF